MISVSMVGANIYQVVVSDEVETEHRVEMSAEYYKKLCGGKVTHEWVLVQAFRFLLKREANTEILSEFELSVIGRYFPEFESELQALLSNSVT